MDNGISAVQGVTGFVAREGIGSDSARNSYNIKAEALDSTDTVALSVSGLPTDRFTFVGFAPHKRAARITWLRPLASVNHTQVLYESPHRILDCLSDIVEVFGTDREICVARELTKRFETVMRYVLALELLASQAGLQGMVVLEQSRASQSSARSDYTVDWCELTSKKICSTSCGCENA